MLSLHQDCHASSRFESLHQLFQIQDFLGIERKNLAAAAIQVVGCQEVRKGSAADTWLVSFLNGCVIHLDDVHPSVFLCSSMLDCAAPIPLLWHGRCDLLEIISSPA